MTALVQKDRARRRMAALGLGREAGWLAACIAAVVTAILLRGVIGTNEDVSWLIDVAERTLAGARPYVDVFEVNPPLSILLYIPPAALGRWLGLGSESVTNALVFAGSAASMAVCLRIALRAALIERRHAGALVLPLTVVLLILPTHTFAQREHIAVMACLPVLFCSAGRCRGNAPTLEEALLMGLGAGLTVSIKPLFALAFLGPVLFLLIRRGWYAALASVELWVGGLLAGIYALGILLLVPAFVHSMLPIAVAVYVPAKTPLLTLLTSHGVLIWLLLALTLTYRWTLCELGALSVVLLGASAGFEAVFLIQGKGYAYHAYPALACAILALGAAMIEGPGKAIPLQRRRIMAVAQPAVLGFASLLAMNMLSRHFDSDVWMPGLAAAIREIAPHPRVLALSPEISVGHPFVRELGGTYVGSAPSTWIGDDVRLLVEQGHPADVLKPYVGLEQEIYTRDIVQNRPDALIVDSRIWDGWTPVLPALATALRDYVERGRFGAVTLWARRDPVTSARPAIIERAP